MNANLKKLILVSFATNKAEFMFYNARARNNSWSDHITSWVSSVVIIFNGNIPSSRRTSSVDYAFFYLDQTYKNKPRDGLFWAVHPFYRGLGAGIVAKLLNPDIQSNAPFSMGFIYGGIAGVANVAVRPLMERLAEIENPASRVTALFAASAIPWITSYYVMKASCAKTNRAIFYITPGSAISVALVIQFFGWVNNDLFYRK